MSVQGSASQLSPPGSPDGGTDGKLYQDEEAMVSQRGSPPVQVCVTWLVNLSAETTYVDAPHHHEYHHLVLLNRDGRRIECSNLRGATVAGTSRLGPASAALRTSAPAILVASALTLRVSTGHLEHAAELKSLLLAQHRASSVPKVLLGLHGDATARRHTARAADGRRRWGRPSSPTVGW